MARSAAVACTETPSHSGGPGNIRVRVRVSFTTGAVRSDILATAGLLVGCLPSSLFYSGRYNLYVRGQSNGATENARHDLADEVTRADNAGYTCT